MPGRPQAVTEAAYRLDDAVAQLAPQVVDMHVEGVALDLAVEAVDRILELFAAEHPTWTVQQRLQQHLLTTRQVDRLLMQKRLAGHRIVTQRAMLDLRAGASGGAAR